MNTQNNTVLITGGATGIGFALAKRFSAAGNTVIVCGRREQTLRAAQSEIPGLQIRVADLNRADERERLAEWTSESFPALNVLVNNAGIQREFRVLDPNVADEFVRENEIETNLTAPVHLTFLLLPHLLRQRDAAVVNVSSGLGFLPIAAMPVYCATKAALQSFSTSLRYQLRDTRVNVFDVAPPLVETDLHQTVEGNSDQGLKGVSPDRVAEVTLRAIERDTYDVAFGLALVSRISSRVLPNVMFRVINRFASGK